MAENLVQVKDVHKSFGEVVALDGVDFELDSNEVVGLVGDNGAGKSTLVKILSGVYPPDKGEIYIKGKKIGKDYSVGKARELGIETVHQENALGEKQPLWRNIFAGRQPTNRLGFIDIDKAKEETQRIMREMVGFTGRGISPDSIVGSLSGGEKQGVSIGRVLYFEADLVILDEPTVGLSVHESEKVADFVKRIKEKGKSCIYISHEVYQTYPVSDRFVILDLGKKVTELRKDEVSRGEVTEELIKARESGGD